ncbi:MAG: YdeI/OmpD-associated family protein [Betaproteobacteria bacterium]
MSTSKARADARDPRVDAYIAAAPPLRGRSPSTRQSTPWAPPFARPVLEHVRGAMHAACPELTEDIKWSHPFYLLEGKPFASTAAFKAHCSLGFWKGGRPIAEAAAAESTDPREKAMGQFGRIETLADLPTAAALRKLIVEAKTAFLAAQDARAAAPPPPRAVREALPVPDDFAAALRAQDAAGKAFAGFTPGQQREYVEWVVEAKRAATRESRIVQAVEWIAEGKTRNWKYQNC